MNELKNKYMHPKRTCVLVLAIAICLAGVLQVLPAQSKPRLALTDEGQSKLMQQVNAGQKSNQLTVKEAKKLRKDLANVARKKAKMIAKNGGKLSSDDTIKLKSDVNKISENLQKLELEKRVQSR